MENASKALVIAGGILFALMTLALVVYMSTATTRLANTQEQKKMAKQIENFNNEYLAYNKKRMYGTDIITVVNKAIEHNKKMLAAPISDPYYIDIEIKVIEKFQTTVDKCDTNKENTIIETLKEPQITDEIKGYLQTKNSFNTYLEIDGTYRLGEWDKNGKNFIINNNFQKFFEGDAEDISAVGDDGYVYIMYSALTNFKRAIFTCPAENGVHYNEKTGRIDKMTFVQIRISTGE